MKKQIMYLCASLFLILACNKESLDTRLETRGNDNHRNWKLSRVYGTWDYSLSDGSEGSGKSDLNYVYGCANPPYGKAISATDIAEEDGNELWNIARTMSYNTNFKIDEEHDLDAVSSSEISRKFQYDAQGKWTGVITTVDGVVLEDTYEINPHGQLINYIHDGVRNEYIWRGENISKVKTYIQAMADLVSVKKSNSFSLLGINSISRKRIKETILQNWQEQQINKSALRSKKSSDWVLVQVEEQTVAHNIIQPFSGPALGYPGSAGDGGYYYLPKNFIIHFKVYSVNTDGTEGDLIFLQNAHTVTVMDNLPDDILYDLEIPHITEDADGNPIDWHESGIYHYDYISGCNETSSLKSK